MDIFEANNKWETIGNLSITDSSFGFVIRSFTFLDIKFVDSLTFNVQIELIDVYDQQGVLQSIFNI